MNVYDSEALKQTDVCYTPVILACKRLKQEDREHEASQMNSPCGDRQSETEGLTFKWCYK